MNRETRALFGTLEEMSMLQIKRGDTLHTSWNVTIQEADLDHNTKKHWTNYKWMIT